MNPASQREVSEDVLRREMESKMTEEERMLAARMAKIAEMAERKSEKKEVNPVLMEIAGKDGKALNSAAAKKNDAPRKLTYIPRAQREKMRQEEEKKKKAEAETKRLQTMRRPYEFSREEEAERKRRREEEAAQKKNKSQSKDTSEDEYTRAIREGIRRQFIGEDTSAKETETAEKTKKKREPTFLMEWKNEDDTSETLNPVYMYRNKVHLGFGKGYVAGVDMCKQRKDSQYMESLLAIRQEAVKNAAVPSSAEENRLNEQLLRSIREKALEKEERAEKKESSGRGSEWYEKELSAMTQRDWRIMREDFEIKVQGARAVNPLRFWREAPIHPAILRAVEELGYKEPTPIQRQAIPIELKGMDMIGIAKTGSGKTCAFVVPMLQYILTAPVENRIRTREEGPLAIVMAPTRELARQIHAETVSLGRYCYDERLTKERSGAMTAVCVVGGESATQQASLTTNGCDVLIATPGRLLDLLRNHLVVLNQTNYIVLDEADRMIDEGFEQDVNTVMGAMGSLMKSEEEEEVEKEAEATESLTSKYRTTIMFSATMAPKVEALAKRYMRCAVQVTIGTSTAANEVEIKQIINMIRENQKPAMLQKVIRNNELPAIVFCNKKETVDAVARALHDQRVRCVALRSGLSQEQREKALEDFRGGVYDVLVATNVAARGLDIKGVKLVVNYDMPSSIEYYIHRIGRTGRAGASGLAISLVTEADSALFPELVEFLRKTKQSIPPELERHRAVREAGQLSSFAGDESADPTEFKMICRCFFNKQALSTR